MGRKAAQFPSNNLKGQKFNRLLVKNLSHRNAKDGQWYWLCRCDCGNEKLVSANHLITGHTKGCGYTCSRKGVRNVKWCGHEGITGTYWCNLKSAARVRSIPFEIDIKDGWELFISQDKKCKLSGLDISFAPMTTVGQKFTGTASLDRIDSTKGYVKGNIQWVHKDINIMKKNHTEEYFLSLCQRIVRHANEKRK